MTTILLVNQDHSTTTAVHHAIASMRDAVYSLVDATNIDDAFANVTDAPPDLIILDSGMIEACARLRTAPQTARKPILFLLHSGSAQEVAQVLDAGGDDCVRRPVNPRELGARVKTLLRRQTRPVTTTESALVLNMKYRRVQFTGRDIDLTPTEFDLLEMLARTPGQHVTTMDLLTMVWQYPTGQGDPALVRNHIRNLRRKLELDPDRPKIITSYHGRGYTVSVKVTRV
jgi:DNA-binding response OmpR family regulator